MIDEIASHRFERLIAAHTGLQLRPREHKTLRGTLAARMAALRLRNADQYHQLLQSGTPDAISEWEQLTASLLNNESYFFRDKGQMSLLRERILPELIARNQARRTLRLWSAGCSTGEEAYSLAIMVEDLLPRHRVNAGSGWQIVILGTDISEHALQHARKGIYSAWSFRTIDPEQHHSFHRQEGGWQVTQATRSLVKFARCNLVADPFPNPAVGLYDMDLILCRNVFIYFSPEAISAVLPKFADTLREGGYLMTGHAETRSHLVEPFKTLMCPESVLYQRVRKTALGIETTGTSPRLPGATPSRNELPAGGLPITPVKPHVLPCAPQSVAAAPTAPTLSATAAQALIDAEAGYIIGDYTATIEAILALEEPAGVRGQMLLARAYANLGLYEKAADCCRQVMSEFPLSSEPYELLASIAQERGDIEDAKLLLKKALYLAPTSPSAYLELGALYQSEGDRERAQKMRLTAHELLLNQPPDAPVGTSGGPNAWEWAQHLKQALKDGE